jgi:cytochrome c-type biogenesis protein CcmH
LRAHIPAALRFIRALILATVFAWGAAIAIDTERAFDDPELQTRYETIIRELRCLVCQNETIADSNADLAADLRHEIRGMIAAGRSDDEIRDFMTQRYGDFVLYRPPLSARTWLLWTAPLLLLAIGGIAAARFIRRRRAEVDSDPWDPQAGPT